MKVSVVTLSGGEAGEIDLDDRVFALEVRKDILARMVRYQLARRRAGTHAVKSRSDVSVTGKKLFRQKGTGNARHGHAAAPQFRGGGRAFGPQVRSHAIKLPKKVRALSLKMALSDKQSKGTLTVLESLGEAPGKTKVLLRQLEALQLHKGLFVGEAGESFLRASRNLHCVNVMPVQGVNTYDVLRHERLVLTKEAVERLVERFV